LQEIAVEALGRELEVKPFNHLLFLKNREGSLDKDI